MAKILLIDNQLLWQRTLSKLLQHEGYEVVLAGSFEEAQNYITATTDIGISFDLILIDLILDEWNSTLEGKDLLPLIEERNKSKRAKVILKDYEFFSTQRWKDFIIQYFTEQREEFVQSCLRDVCPVKIYRYVALQIVGELFTNVYHIFNSDLRILDAGCSINIGAKCLNDLEIFKPIEIVPDISAIIRGTLSQFPLESVLGIDKYEPSLERTLASLFSSEVKFWEEKYTKLYSLVKENVDYQQQDILYLDRHEEYRSAFDIVFLGSLLRRFPSHLIADVLVQVNYATHQRSFLVINEQVSKEVIEGGGQFS